MNFNDTTNRGEPSLSVRDFCVLHKIARATYYKMKRAGHGPDELRVPGTYVIRILPESERAWRERMTELSKSDAVALAKHRRQQQAVAAANASAESDKHVSRRREAAERKAARIVRRERSQRRARR